MTATQPTDRATHVMAEAKRFLDALLPSAVALRQSLHADPEVGGTEDRTVQKLLDYLNPGSVTRVAEGFFFTTGDSGPAIGIRAELDALAVQENSDYSHPSQVPGVGHVCGHDLHMAALALATRVVTAVDFDCRLVSVFQPREETVPSGAVDMMADTAFQQLGLSAMLGMHLQPVLGDRMFSAVAGPVNASADEFTVRIAGRPSHGAYPHQSRDPIVAAAQLVNAVQTLTSRESDPMQPSVVSVGRVHGGDAVNAIPGVVELGGTIRSHSETSRTQLHHGLRRVAAGIAQAADVEVTVDIDLGEPVLINDAAVASVITDSLVDAGFVEGPALRSCGADDFAYYGGLVPSTMVFTGTGVGGTAVPGLHHPAFAPEDEMVRTLAEMMLVSLAALAWRGLEA